MDIYTEVEKLTDEVAALRNEIWGLKEIVIQQNETITKLIKEQQKSFKTAVKSNEGNSGKKVSSSKTLVRRFPIETQDELDYIEDEINENNKDEIASLVSSLIYPGGFHKNMLKILSDDIIMNYNIDGRHNKKKLSDYPMLMDVLAKATEPAGWDHKLFIDDLRKGLAYAKNRHFGKNWVLKKKSQMEQSKTDEMDMEDIEEIILPFT